MDTNTLEILIPLLMFSGMISLFVFLIMYSNSTRFNLDYDSSRGVFRLKRGTKQFYELPRNSVEELVMGKYTVQRKNSTETYYTLCLKISEDIISKITQIYPDFIKCPVDSDAYRFHSDKNMTIVRSKLEEIAKMTNLPIRGLGGELRMPGELDRPYYDLMKDKLDLQFFPPQYRIGDALEVKNSKEGIEMFIHKKMYVPSIILSIVAFVFSAFYIFLWMDGEFAITEVFDWVWILLSHSPLIGLIVAAFYFYFQTKHLNIRISQGFLYIQRQKIPLRDVEEVHADMFAIYFQTDKKSFIFRHAMYISPIAWNQFNEMIKKMIVYQGLR